MKRDVWRERKDLSDSADFHTEYWAETFCTNGCGYKGRRQLIVKKGVRRDSIKGVTCKNCGCKADVV